MWKSAEERAVRAFERATAELDDAEPRSMFGYACRFANGHLFIGTHEAGIILRLPDPERSEFRSRYGAALFEPMAGRPMREYVVVPEALFDDAATLRRWVERSLAYVMSLPTKVKKAKPAKPKATAAKSVNATAAKATLEPVSGAKSPRSGTRQASGPTKSPKAKPPRSKRG